MKIKNDLVETAPCCCFEPVVYKWPTGVKWKKYKCKWKSGPVKILDVHIDYSKNITE